MAAYVPVLKLVLMNSNKSDSLVHYLHKYQNKKIGFLYTGFPMYHWDYNIMVFAPKKSIGIFTLEPTSTCVPMMYILNTNARTLTLSNPNIQLRAGCFFPINYSHFKTMGLLISLLLELHQVK